MVVRICKPKKNIQCNVHKRIKNDHQNTTQVTKDQVTRTPEANLGALEG